MPLEILHLHDSCTACGACVSVCPKCALQLIPDQDGFYYPSLDHSKCVNCKSCEKVCHVLNLKKDNSIERDYTPYMIQSRSEELLHMSSSGGFFSLLAYTVLREGGVVYGARYDYGKERLEHSSTDFYSLSEFRKSKYIESYLGSVFCDVYKNLADGRHVLFCGTPCQIRGLKFFLENKKACFDRLLLVRLICHGVPSNQFFTEYKRHEEKRKKRKVYSIDFRPKNHGWWTSNLVMKFEDGKSLDEGYACNYYYYCFQHNLFLRRSCYHCNYLNTVEGDFTIGDFWGIYMYNPNNKDNRGLSLVLAHSRKASEAIETIREEAVVSELPMSSVDYIYKGIGRRESYLPESERLMKTVRNIGYMPALKKEIGNIIRKQRILHAIRSTMIWRILRRVKSAL